MIALLRCRKLEAGFFVEPFLLHYLLGVFTLRVENCGHCTVPKPPENEKLGGKIRDMECLKSHEFNRSRYDLNDPIVSDSTAYFRIW
jgi:hypothetical protein